MSAGWCGAEWWCGAGLVAREHVGEMLAGWWWGGGKRRRSKFIVRSKETIALVLADAVTAVQSRKHQMNWKEGQAYPLWLYTRPQTRSGQVASRVPSGCKLELDVFGPSGWRGETGSGRREVGAGLATRSAWGWLSGEAVVAEEYAVSCSAGSTRQSGINKLDCRNWKCRLQNIWWSPVYLRGAAGLGWEAQSEDKQLCSLFEEKIKKIFVLKIFLKGFLFF